MNNEVINRTTLNGAKWQIVKDNWGVALYLNNFGKEGYHFSGDIFNSVEEAQKHLDKIDEKIANPPKWEPLIVPDDYYAYEPGRYYGD